MSEAVEILIKADDKASAKFANVAANAEKAAQKSGNAFKEMGGRAKATTEFVGTLANLTGNSQVGALAGILAQATEKASAFSEVAKAGGAGALAFKLGLVGLAATAGGIVGKAIGDLIFQTAKFERSMVKAKDAAKDLDSQIKTLQDRAFANQREDIELIRDPEAKRAAYNQLLADLNRDIQTASDIARKSAREVEAWAEAWKITGNQKAFAEQASEQLAIDKERLATLKAQRDEVIRIAGARAQEHDRIRAAQEAEEQQAEAAKKWQEERRKAVEEYWKAMADARKEALREQEKAEEAAKRETQRVEDLIATEQERLALQRIELEHGKEVARVHELVGQGVEETIAKQLAAEESAIEALRKRKDEEGKPKTDLEKKVSAATDLQANQSRLLTRGQASPLDTTNKLLEQARKHAEQLAQFNEQQLEQQKLIAQNTANTLTVRQTT